MTCGTTGPDSRLAACLQNSSHLKGNDPHATGMNKVGEQSSGALSGPTFVTQQGCKSDSEEPAATPEVLL